MSGQAANRAGKSSGRQVKTSLWERKNGSTEGICRNCGMEVTGKYCPECGQKTTTRRLTLSASVANFINAVFHIERGLFKTSLQLFYRPGYMSRDYIEGQRMAYANPFSLMVLLAGLYGILYLVMIWTQSEYTSSLEAYQLEEQLFTNTERELTFFEQTLFAVVRWLVDSAFILSLFMLPIYTAFIKLCFWRSNRRRYNYTELLFVSGYIAAQRFIIDLVYLPYRWIFWNKDDLTSHWMVSWSLYFVFTVITLKQLFGTRWIGTVWRTVWMLIFSFFAALLVIIGLIIAVYWIFEGGNIFTADIGITE